MEQKVRVGDVVCYNGKRYRAEAEVEKCTCIGCDLYDDGERLCGDRFPCGGHLIFKEVKEVKETPRRIELGVVKVEGDKVTFRIVEQTHRLGDFSQQIDPNTFKASNEIVFKSQIHPEWGGDDFILFCRGSSSDKDNLEVVCTTSEFARISEAISEYNATDGKGYEKPWPRSGDIYFYVASDYTIVNDNFYSTSPGDKGRFDCGNFFRTREKAEAAAEKIKALLKELAAK